MESPSLIEILESRIAPASAISISDVTLAEGNANTTDFEFHVTLDQPDNANTITVHYATADGTAKTSDNDYTGIADTVLTFDPGQTDKTVTVKVKGDTKHEANEGFTVKLTNATNATIADDTGAGTIQNDDAVATMSIDDPSASEGNVGQKNLAFTVSLSNAMDTDVTVHYKTQDGTATTSDNDYVGIPDTVLTIAAGTTSKTVNVAIKGDQTVEPDQDFTVVLSNADNGVTIGKPTGTGTIVNDDTTGLTVAANGKSATYTDEDGDLVKVTTSKGVLLAQNFSFDTTGKQLQMLDLSANSSVAGANITFTTGTPAGKVKVGYIKALEGSSGIDLGAVKLPGDLGRIDVGDDVSVSALKSLTVDSIGINGFTTVAPDLMSLYSSIRGSAGSITVNGDVQDASIFVTDITGKVGNASIGVLKIIGSLKGGSANNSGEIFFTGTLGKGTVGSIAGGTGNVSGAILGDYATLSKINSLTVNGPLGGSGGNESGEIAATVISSLTINGDVIGAGGNGSGLIQSPDLRSLTINGSLLGGAGFNSGEIFGDAIGKIVIRDNLEGGTAGTAAAQGHSGTIETEKLGSLTIKGSMIGGDFADAGHTANFSGVVTVKGVIGSISIAQDLKGGTGDFSGNILAQGAIGKLSIGRDFIGHDGGTTMLTNSGYIEAGKISTLTIGRNFESGLAGTGGVDSSGTIRSVNDLGSVTIKGNVVGKANNPAIISAVGQAALSATAKTDLAIKSVTIGGSADRFDLLAGYGTDTSTNLLGQPINADASIGTVKIAGTLSASNIIAGAMAGAGSMFGDPTDARISGAGVRDDFDLISKISSVIVGGAASGTAADDAENFGIVAQQVVAVRVAGAVVPLTTGPSNDFKAIGTTPGTANGDGFDFHVFEVV